MDESSVRTPLWLDWKARYELWSIPLATKLCSVEVDLPFPKIFPLLEFKRTMIGRSGEGSFGLFTSRQGHSVSLPVAISNDVRRAVILDSVVHICLQQAEPTSTSVTSGALLCYQILDVTTKGNFTPFRADIKVDDEEYDDSFYLKFSISAKYLVLIRESARKAAKNDFSYGQLWWMQVFVDKNFETSSHPDYVSLRASTFFAVPEISILSPCRGVAFHPALPRLAFPQVVDGLPQTYLWDFEDPVTTDTGPGSCVNPFPVHDPPIVDPYFVDEGIYLCGTDAPLQFGTSVEISQDFCTPIIVQVPDPVRVVPSILNPSLPSKIQKNPLQTKSKSHAAACDLACRPKEVLQRANSLVFERGIGGVVHISQLHNLERQDAVVLRTLGQDQTPRAFTLTRLPHEVKNCVDVSLLHGLAGERDADARSDSARAPSGSVHLVLNKAHQKDYTARDVGDTILPALIERDMESIPSVINTVPVLRIVHSDGLEDC
jgi:hypothetical protein